jgi:uncharacterized protein (TIGR00725 family)
MFLIGVIGSSVDEEELNRLAYEVGRHIANRGAVLLCGGLGGVMENACRGAKEAGGLTVGVIPGEDKEDANPCVDIPIVTGIGKARNMIVARTADAIIAVGGRYGTLSEIAYALHFGKKVFALKSWDELESEKDFVVVNSPEEAVELAFKYHENIEKT